MALGSGIKRQQKKSQDGAQKKKDGILTKLKDPVELIDEAFRGFILKNNFLVFSDLIWDLDSQKG